MSDEIKYMEAAHAILQRAVDHYGSVSQATTWFSSPHPQLDGQIPGILVMCGRADEVHRFLDNLDAGVYP